ncbi:hypothetical protein GGQ97_001386 [Sphingomonas kaistensis]|uniref:Uncharacterized protein n=1 Tax=Sphingomonas kaistensis TaxID=298708 RepID=A0A7X5Y5I5_9SPHN|nr:hypothetical protein [Sphingomonas kaistensis]
MLQRFDCTWQRLNGGEFIQQIGFEFFQYASPKFNPRHVALDNIPKRHGQSHR